MWNDIERLETKVGFQPYYFEYKHYFNIIETFVLYNSFIIKRKEGGQDMKKTITYDVNQKTVEREINYIPVRYIIAVFITLFEVLAVM